MYDMKNSSGCEPELKGQVMKMQKLMFPVLESKIAERNITKKSIAQGLGIDAVTLSRKLAGKVGFTLKEIQYIHEMFPESSVESLFGLHSDADNSKALTLSVKLDDTEFMKSLEKIEKRIEEMTEKANRLKSALEECETEAQASVSKRKNCTRLTIR